MLSRRTFLSSCAATAALAQTRAELAPAKLLEIDRIVTSEMSRTGAPAVSLAIVMDGEFRYANGYGLADLENMVPATAETSYRLASVSKPITATAVMQLVERGKLELDVPVQRYVPSFPEKQWPVTVRQLLGHLGGIRGYRGEEARSPRHFSSVVEGLEVFARDPLVSEPGTTYLYSSYGFNLVGAAVETASGERFIDYLRRHIFEPAGMDRIRDDSVYSLIPHRAQGYFKNQAGVLENSALADTSGKIPGGGLCGTVCDLARFVMALDAGKLVSDQSRQLMQTSQRLRDGRRTSYGFGWGLEDRDGFHYALHSGGQPRVSTMLATIPARRFAVAWMCNLEGSGMRLHFDLARLLLA